MYMNYGFILEWLDLDENLREEKIQDYINFHSEGEDYIITEKEAERAISSRFPIYF